MSKFAHEFVLPLGGEVAIPSATEGLSISVSAQAEVDYGTDFDVLFDLDPHLGLVSGAKNVGQAIARAVCTPSGFFADAFDGDPGYGEDLLGDLVNMAMDDAGAAVLAARLEQRAEADPRVARADVVAPFSFAEDSIAPTIRLDLNDGPFDQVRPIGEVTVEIALAKGGI